MFTKLAYPRPQALSNPRPSFRNAHLRRRRSGLAAGNPDGMNRQLITTKHVLIFCCLILPFAFGAVLILMELISPGSTSVQGGVGGGGN